MQLVGYRAGSKLLYGCNVGHLKLKDLLPSEVQMNDADLNNCEHKIALIVGLPLGTYMYILTERRQIGKEYQVHEVSL